MSGSKSFLKQFLNMIYKYFPSWIIPICGLMHYPYPFFFKTGAALLFYVFILISYSSYSVEITNPSQIASIILFCLIFSVLIK